MYGKTVDVIGGFKANVENLQEQEEFNILLSVKMFDHDETVIMSSTNVNELNEAYLDRVLQVYTPRGQTALRDALGTSITNFINLYRTEPFHSCMIYVMTDGLENCSRMFSADTIKDLVQKAERECNIKVFYVGSNQDAEINASHIGIPAGHALDFVDDQEVAVQEVFRSLSSVAARWRSGDDATFNENERTASRPHAPLALEDETYRSLC
jgi:hypothetical protein